MIVKDLLSSLFSNIFNYICVFLCGLILGGYFGYSWTADHYKSQIQKVNLQVEKEKNDIQRKGDQLVAQYVDEIGKLHTTISSLQKQVPMVFGNIRAASCSVPLGFVRLYNASATSTASAPSDSDGTTSGVDLATILYTDIENHQKYRQVVQQLIQLQEFVRQTEQK
jgi:hypothetical protein